MWRFRCRRNRRAAQLARLLVALDVAAGGGRVEAPRRVSRASLGAAR